MSSTAIHLSKATFTISAPDIRRLPADSGIEVAFAGRSNAGKSSALNTLTNQRSLARTSKTPGRTQLINFFNLNDQQRLVDLPGYGYAKVPIEVKLKWQRHLEDYLRQRQSLQGLVLLMDCRHPLQEFDQMMLSWAQSSHMPVHVLLTKADKLKSGAAKNTLLKVRRELEPIQELVSVQLFSSSKRTGLPELRKVLSEWLALTPSDEPATERNE